MPERIPAARAFYFGLAEMGIEIILTPRLELVERTGDVPRIAGVPFKNKILHLNYL